MKNRICTKCHKRKKITEFNKDKRYTNDYRGQCKECMKKYNQKRYQRIKEELKKQHKIYRANNKTKIAESNKKYQIKNKNKIKEYHKKYYQKNIKKIKEYKEKYKKRRNKSVKEKRKNNINFKLKNNLRIRIYKVLKGINKSKSTMKLVGCSISHLKQYLQKQFKKRMSWKNYGKYGWHIDHIIPCCSFDLSKPSEQRKCFNYINLQPLWAEENLRKGRKRK